MLTFNRTAIFALPPPLFPVRTAVVNLTFNPVNPFDGKVLAVQLLPENGQGKVHLEMRPIAGNTVSAAFRISLGDFLGASQKNYKLYVFILESLSSTVIDAGRKKLLRGDILASNKAAPRLISLLNKTSPVTISLNFP